MELRLPLRLNVSLKKWILLLLLSVAFVLASILLIPEKPFVAWSSIVLFGLGVVVAAINLHPNSGFLLLEASGFTFSSLFRRHFVPWSDVEKFVLARIHTRQMVGWTYTPQYRKSKGLRRVNTMLAGAEAALPDTYGKSAAELVSLLEACRARHGVPVS